jgi:S-adenosylmethionine:tRNA ribosyltransferase-isomerase
LNVPRGLHRSLEGMGADGAGSENRTRTLLPEPDFESGASTSSAIPARASSVTHNPARPEWRGKAGSVAAQRGAYGWPILRGQRGRIARHARCRFRLFSAERADRPASASRPLGARLLVLEDVEPRDSRVREIGELLRSGDLLVLNDTRVIPARLLGRKATGGQVEVLVERIEGPDTALALVRASKSPPVGSRLWLEEAVEMEVIGREGMFFRLRLLNRPDFLGMLREHGHVPLPPYIERPDSPEDQERYQTVYASRDGAVAAPTAGLHFDAPLLEALKGQGVEVTNVTLHVGAGTFQPVKVENTEEHRMHAEYAEVSAETCAAIAACKARGGRVVAVGTTSMRSLESAAATAQEFPDPSLRRRDAPVHHPRLPVPGGGPPADQLPPAAEHADDAGHGFRWIPARAGPTARGATTLPFLQLRRRDVAGSGRSGRSAAECGWEI